MGPLQGIRIVELAGIGPGPFAAMLLADLGATVIRIDRPTPSGLGIPQSLKTNLVLRNRGTIELDLKSETGRELALALVEQADGLIEGFRPGVTERLGLGPEPCLARNARLVYGRMTGWGQDGPLALAAGHDLNYIAVTGVLDAIGRAGAAPTPPLNLVGDYGGGALYLALGMLAGILHARSSGQGQVVDAAIVDGTASLATALFGALAAGMLGERGTNVLDSGAPYYETYQCADGKWISVAPIEAKFHAELCQRMEIDPAELGQQNDRAAWPQAKRIFAARFKQRTRDEWCALLEGSDACVAAVMSPAEAPTHAHLAARNTFITVDGIVQPAPAPRFSQTPAQKPVGPKEPDAATTRDQLQDWLGTQQAAHWSSRLGL